MNERTGVLYVEGQTDEEGLLTVTMYGSGLGDLVSLMKKSPSREGALEGIHIEGKIVVACPGSIWESIDNTDSTLGAPPGDHPYIAFADEAMLAASPLLCNHMDNNTSVEIILSIMQDSYPEGLGIKQFTFDGCHIDDREFQIDSHGYALTTYTFTADRLREA